MAEEPQEQVTETVEGEAPSSPQTNQGIHWGIGRRKSSVARVRVIEGGSGRILVNGKPLDEFFNIERHRQIAVSPLECTDKADKLDVLARCTGGGITGQSGSVRLGIARALVEIDSSLEHTLREKGHLTRDGRMSERKKYGRRGARRGFQFSKR